MLKIKCFHSKEGYGANCYILSDGMEYAIVDPSVSYTDLLKQYKIPTGALKYIIVTHAHFDHILEIDSWVKNTDAAVLIGADDMMSLSDSYKNCYSLFFGKNKGYHGKATPLYDGDKLTLGDSVLEVISTPGHTPGGIALICGAYIIVGDTIFAQGYGRCDLPGGDFNILVKTIHKLCALPHDIVVYSGHGEASTIGKINRYLNF